MNPETIEEISALQAIYDDLEVNDSSVNCRIKTPDGNLALLHIVLSSTYPYTGNSYTGNFTSTRSTTSTAPYTASSSSFTDTKQGTVSFITKSDPFRLRFEISGLPRGNITQKADDHLQTLINQTPEGEPCLFPIISYFREEFAVDPLLAQQNESHSNSASKSKEMVAEENDPDDNGDDNNNSNSPWNDEELQNIIVRDGELSFIPRRKFPSFSSSLASNGSSSSHHHQYHHSSSSSSTVIPDAISILHGRPHVEKKSTFQAHIARIYSKEDVYDILNALKSVSKIARATHNMYAYRFTDPDTRTLVADNDDDGEDAAGGRLAELLHNMDVMNILVIVSRWFGGVLMGPSRFKTINNVARDLIEQQDWYQQEHAAKDTKGKKR